MSQPDTSDPAARGAADGAGGASRAHPPDRGRGGARRRGAGSRWRRALVIAVPVAAAVAGAAILLRRRERQPPTAPTSASPPARKAARPASSDVVRHERRRERPGRPPGPGPGPRPADHDVARAPPPEHPGRLGRDEAGGRDRPLARRLPEGAERRRRGPHGLRVARPPHPEAERPAGGLAALRPRDDRRRERPIQDIQAQVDATARKIARLQARLAYWQAQPQTRRGRQARGGAHGCRSRSSAAAGRPRSRRRATRTRLGADDDEAGARARRTRATARCTTSASRSAGSGSSPSTCSRSRAASSSWARSSGSPRAPSAGTARTSLLSSAPDLGEDPERRLADRQLAELGVDAAGLVGARGVGRSRPRSCTSAAARAPRGSRRSPPSAAPRPPACRGRSRPRRPSACSRRRCAPRPRRSRRTGSSSRGRPRGTRPCRSEPRSGGTASPACGCSGRDFVVGWLAHSHCRHVRRDLQDLTFPRAGGSPRRLARVARRLYLGVSRAHADRPLRALRRARERHGALRAVGARADPARLSDRRGDRARRRAHRLPDRRVPERELRQRARADHLAVRDQRQPARGRARLDHGLRRLVRPPRPRRSDGLRRRRRRRPPSLLLQVGVLARRDRLLPVPSVPVVERQSRAAHSLYLLTLPVAAASCS